MLISVEGQEWSCLCGAGPSLELLDRAGERVATIEIHHQGLRTALWTGEAQLVDVDALTRWFEARGVRREALACAITDADIADMYD